MGRILYVDANGERAGEVVAELTARGHHVDEVRSAERAMLSVEREPDYDMVLMHLLLPGTDAAELCRWLRRSSSAAAVPRVVFTSPEVELRLDLSGELPSWLPADLYLHGVEDYKELGRAVDGVLAGR
jgi:CheY-like chemotaxis protein